MKNEAAFWTQWLRPLLHQPTQKRWAWKIPAEMRTGLPDVNFGNTRDSGWIELKYRSEWPQRPETPIEVAVTDEQYAHLRQVHDVSRPAFCLLGVDDWFFLLTFPVLRPHIRYTRRELEHVAVTLGRIRQDDRRLLTALGVDFASS